MSESPIDPPLQFVLNAYYGEYFVELEAIAAACSLVGCIFTIMISLKHFSRRYINRMIIILCLIDIVFALSAFWQWAPSCTPFLCKLLSLISCASYAGSLVLTCCFAHSLYAVLNHHSPVYETVEHNWRFYMTITTIVGSINGFFALIFNFRRVDDFKGHCVHFNSKGPGTNLIVDTIPAIICDFYCIFCYALVIRKLKTLSQRYHMELMCYPIIIVICTLPKAVKEIMIFFEGEPSVEFYFIQGILSVLQGFFNAMAYGVVHKIQNCRKNRNVQEEEEDDDTMSLGNRSSKQSLV